MRRFILLLAIVAVSLLALAPSASAARTRIGGDYVVHPGQGIDFSSVTFSACNTLRLGYDIIREDGSVSQEGVKAHNDGAQCTTADGGGFGLFNTESGTLLVRLWLLDETCSHTYLAGSDHSRITNRQAAFNDGGGGCSVEDIPALPGRVKGQLTGNVVMNVSVE